MDGGDGSISTSAWTWWYSYMSMHKLSSLDNEKISEIQESLLLSPQRSPSCKRRNYFQLSTQTN